MKGTGRNVEESHRKKGTSFDKCDEGGEWKKEPEQGARTERGKKTERTADFLIVKEG